MTDQGWVCPRCQTVHAPWVASCSEEELARLMYDTAFPNRWESWPNVRDYWVECARTVLARLCATATSRPRVGREWFYCSDCRTVGVSVDEDGLCVTCGVDTILVNVSRQILEPDANEMSAKIEALEAALEKISEPAYWRFGGCYWCEHPQTRDDFTEHNDDCPVKVARAALNTETDG